MTERQGERRHEAPEGHKAPKKYCCLRTVVDVDEKTKEICNTAMRVDAAATVV